MNRAASTKTKPETTTMRVDLETYRRFRALCDRLGWKLQTQTNLIVQNRIAQMEKLESTRARK